jgi:hypothetical protein
MAVCTFILCDALPGSACSVFFAETRGTSLAQCVSVSYDQWPFCTTGLVKLCENMQERMYLCQCKHVQLLCSYGWLAERLEPVQRSVASMHLNSLHASNKMAMGHLAECTSMFCCVV